MCFIFSFWARAIVLCTSKDVYQEAGLYMSLINLKNGLLLFCVIILLISFCLFPVKYVSRAVAICLEQKTCFLSCFCSCSLYNIETVRTAQMYSSATVFSLYMKIDLSTYTYIGSSTSIYIHLHACACHVLTSELDCFLPQTPWRPSRALRGHVSQFLYMEVSSLQAEGGKKPEAANYIIFLLQSLLFFTANCTRSGICIKHRSCYQVLSQASGHCISFTSPSDSPYAHKYAFSVEELHLGSSERTWCVGMRQHSFVGSIQICFLLHHHLNCIETFYLFWDQENSTLGDYSPTLLAQFMWLCSGTDAERINALAGLCRTLWLAQVYPRTGTTCCQQTLDVFTEAQEQQEALEANAELFPGWSSPTRAELLLLPRCCPGP